MAIESDEMIKRFSSRSRAIHVFGRLLGSIIASLLLGCVSTDDFVDAEGSVVPGSIASMEMVPLGGVDQSVWFRGVSRNNPVLILLHGGPGASESALFRYFNSELEQHFLVAYWEQRGTGRSFHEDVPESSMTVDRMVQDLDELVGLIQRRFNKDAVFLLGHSWGTVLGTIYASRHPKNVIAYVGVAQIANVTEGDLLSYRFAKDQVALRKDRGILACLAEIGRPPYSDPRERLAIGKMVERYGGMYYGPLSTGSLILAALSTDEANLVDLVKFGQGNAFSLRLLEREFSNLRLADHYVRFDIPVLFILGRHDMHVPSLLAARYFEKIKAPWKQLVWFDRSAHNPPFEEPERFNKLLIEKLLPLAGAHPRHTS